MYVDDPYLSSYFISHKSSIKVGHLDVMAYYLSTRTRLKKECSALPKAPSITQIFSLDAVSKGHVIDVADWSLIARCRMTKFFTAFRGRQVEVIQGITSFPAPLQYSL